MGGLKAKTASFLGADRRQRSTALKKIRTRGAAKTKPTAPISTGGNEKSWTHLAHFEQTNRVEKGPGTLERA